MKYSKNACMDMLERSRKAVDDGNMYFYTRYDIYI